MRRGARSLLAVVVGFVGATAVFQAAGLEPLGRDGPVVLGDADIAAYCRALYGPDSNAMLVGANAYSWRCSTRANDVFRLVDVDMDQLCADQFGDDTRPNSWDSNSPHSWECLER